MASVLSSPSVILAAAMAASGAFIYLSISRHNQKTTSTTQFSSEITDHHRQSPSNRALRSCLISSGENKTKKGKNKKRVHFADTVRRAAAAAEYSTPLTRRLITQHAQPTTKITSENSNNLKKKNHHRIPFRQHEIRAVHRVMPANRVALYSGILRDRVQLHRTGCSY